MTDFARSLYRLTLAAGLILMALLAPGSSGRADDDEIQNAPVRPRFTLDENSFNRIVYGNLGPDATRRAFEHYLALRIARVERTSGITPAQRAGLELAGKGDIKRHFDRIEDRRNFVNRPLEQEEYARVWQDIQTLNRTQGAVLFGSGSLFAKALKTTLAEDQATRYGDFQRERDRARYQVRVEQCVLELDNALGLSTAQRQRLVDLLMHETQPPKTSGQYDILFIQYQMSRLPESRLKLIFDDAQWRGLRLRLARAQAMEAVVERNGGRIDGDLGGFVAPAIAPAPPAPPPPPVPIAPAARPGFRDN
jgi:hypothetical protein